MTWRMPAVSWDFKWKGKRCGRQYLESGYYRNLPAFYWKQSSCIAGEHHSGGRRIRGKPWSPFGNINGWFQDHVLFFFLIRFEQDRKLPGYYTAWTHFSVTLVSCPHFNDEGATLCGDDNEIDIDKYESLDVKYKTGYGQEEFCRKMGTKVAMKEYFRDKNLKPQTVQIWMAAQGIEDNLLYYCSRQGESS